MMTMEQKFYSMTMKTLVAEAEKLGVKIDKKGSKAKAVEKMLAALVTATEQPVVVEEPVVDKPAAVATAVEEQPRKERKASTRKKTFEELVADIPAPGNIRFVRAANGDVLVKRNKKRIFRYNGHTLIATTESRFAGCEYEKQNWNGYVIHNVTPEIMWRVFQNI